MTRTLILILAFVAFMLGNFIWFVVTWDSAKEEPVSRAPLPQETLQL